MKIFPKKMKQYTKYILLIIVALGIAVYGMTLGLNNNILLRLIANLLAWLGLIGLVVEIIKKIKKK